MATFDIKGSEKWAIALDKLEAGMDEIARRAVYSGMEPVADAMNSAIDDIPEDKFRYLQDGDMYNSITEKEKADLKESFGVTKIKGDSFEGWNVKAGFDGYGHIPTKKYPKGVPNQLVARSVESGSSVRVKYPFVRRAVNATKKESVNAMDKSVDADIKILMS